jgi:hypothetical protein
MLKRSTWILLAILALAVGVYFLIKSHPLKAPDTTPTVAANGFLVAQSEGVLQSLRIQDSQGGTFQMQRDLSKTWVIVAPTSGAADQGQASAAETQVGALSIITTLPDIPPLDTIGLEKPAYTVELGFVSGKNHKIEVGSLTPTSSGYYVRYDGGKIYVIGQYGIDALVKLLQSPPYPPTETPSPTALTSVTPTPDVASPTP